jgi:hypothetical protein
MMSYTRYLYPSLARRCSFMISTLALAGALALGIMWGQAPQPAKTDAEIKQAIIKESIAAYRGSCPCPYNVDRAGRRCGARSAYSRPGGASPICYEKDVTQAMIDDYRKSHK